MDQADDWLFVKLADVYEAEDNAEGVPRGLLTARQVCTLVNMSKDDLYSSVSDGEFPRPKRFGASNTRWLESDIQEWQKNLPDGHSRR